jgi:hypothetical protein
MNHQTISRIFKPYRFLSTCKLFFVYVFKIINVCLLQKLRIYILSYATPPNASIFLSDPRTVYHFFLSDRVKFCAKRVSKKILYNLPAPVSDKFSGFIYGKGCFFVTLHKEKQKKKEKLFIPTFY